MARFQPSGDDAERELANAGRVMNGRRLNTGVVRAMERRLEKHEPEVLVVGNSFANTNVDTKVLAKELSIPAEEVGVLSVPNSVGSHWYAILENRVFDNGHHPSLIVVVSNLQSALLVQPYSEASFTNYTVQLDRREPVLDPLVPRGLQELRALRERRGAVKDAWMGAVRDASVGLVFPRKGLRRATERAMDVVFADDKVDMSRYAHALPVSETRDGGPGAIPSPAESLLPELARLASENGSRLVVVRSPMAPRTPEAELDVVPDGYDAATDELLSGAGHVFVDLSELPFPDRLFVNPGHMTDEGGRRFTRALGRVLQAEGVEAEGGGGVWRIRAPAVSVDGPAVPDPEGLSALHDGLWVGPGGTLRVRFAEGWRAPATWDLSLIAERVGPGPRPEIRVGGKRVKPDVNRTPDGRARFRVESPRPAPRGPWTVAVAVPKGSSPVLVQGLRVGSGPGAWQVIGRARNHEAIVHELLGEAVFVDHHVRFEAAPADPPAPPGKRRIGPGEQLVLTIGPRVMQRFREGARSLGLTASSPSGKPVTATVMVRAGGKPVLRDVLLAGGDGARTRSYGLSEPMWPSDELQLVIDNPSEHALVLTGAELRASPGAGSGASIQ